MLFPVLSKDIVLVTITGEFLDLGLVCYAKGTNIANCYT